MFQQIQALWDTNIGYLGFSKAKEFGAKYLFKIKKKVLAPIEVYKA